MLASLPPRGRPPGPPRAQARRRRGGRRSRSRAKAAKAKAEGREAEGQAAPVARARQPDPAPVAKAAPARPRPVRSASAEARRARARPTPSARRRAEDEAAERHGARDDRRAGRRRARPVGLSVGGQILKRAVERFRSPEVRAHVGSWPAETGASILLGYISRRRTAGPQPGGRGNHWDRGPGGESAADAAVAAFVASPTAHLAGTTSTTCMRPCARALLVLALRGRHGVRRAGAARPRAAPPPRPGRLARHPAAGLVGSTKLFTGSAGRAAGRAVTIERFDELTGSGRR